ncbi:MAG: type II toxin-antitoxin system RelE/ParE family toxin [Rhodocyclaceae bacterium]|nr:type II toxin-antitoxin system RelE/ParE family toxin [Rhodocyclaceae bacterium]
MTAYVFTDEAETDMRGIARYTRKVWGSTQGRRYIAKLKQGIAALVDGSTPFRDMGRICPGLRMVHCEHHYVFCVVRENEAAVVVAVLHERMDFLARLSVRLGATSRH